MTSGIVMFYNQDRGLGIISSGKNDKIIVCQNDLEQTQLKEGDKVNFDITQNNGSRCAVNIKKNGTIFKRQER